MEWADSCRNPLKKRNTVPFFGLAELLKQKPVLFSVSLKLPDPHVRVWINLQTWVRHTYEFAKELLLLPWQQDTQKNFFFFCVCVGYGSTCRPRGPLTHFVSVAECGVLQLSVPLSAHRHCPPGTHSNPIAAQVTQSAHISALCL